MQEYSLKRGYKPDLERLEQCLIDIFPVDVLKEEDKLVISYGTFKKMAVWIQNKKMVIETKNNDEAADDDTILDTNKRFRDFLYQATGYTAKERVKKAKEAVSKKA